MSTTPPAATSLSRKRLPPWASLFLRFVATAGLLFWALRGIDWREFVSLIVHADWRWWAAGVTTALFVQVIAGIRWAALARPIGFPFALRTFVWRFFEGMFFSLCLPSSIGGDVVKAYRLGDTTQRRLLAGCTVLADRLTGVTALGVLGGTALLAARYSLGLPASLAVAAVLLALAAAGFWLAVSSLDRVLDLLPAPHPARQFISQLLPYQQRPSLMTRALGWSLVIQMGGAVSVAFVARALGVDQPLTVWFYVVPLIALAMVLPVSINGVGVREGGMKLLLHPYGVTGDKAVAVGLLWLACTIIAGLLGGLLFLLDRKPSGAGSAPVEAR